jgi:hypothetical protein
MQKNLEDHEIAQAILGPVDESCPDFVIDLHLSPCTPHMLCVRFRKNTWKTPWRDRLLVNLDPSRYDELAKWWKSRGCCGGLLSKLDRPQTIYCLCSNKVQDSKYVSFSQRMYITRARALDDDTWLNRIIREVMILKNVRNPHFLKHASNLPTMTKITSTARLSGFLNAALCANVSWICVLTPGRVFLLDLALRKGVLLSP